MCRILALRSQAEVPLYRFLLAGDNSFAVQSLEHPDGWGLAYYLEEGPVVAAQLSDVEAEEIEIGMEVEMVTRRIRELGPQGYLVYGYRFRPSLKAEATS